MDPQDLSQIVYACLNSSLDRNIYLKLKEYLLTNYKENDLARYLLSDIKVPINNGSCTYQKNTEGIVEFKTDADRIFATSRNAQFMILQRYSNYVSKEILDEFRYYTNILKTNDLIETASIDNIFNSGLGPNLKQYIDKYLSLSKSHTTNRLTAGATAICYRLGDYILKVISTKHSSQDPICPNNFLFIKNLEEDYIRGRNGIVLAGLEVQQYLKRSAKNILDTG